MKRDFTLCFIAPEFVPLWGGAGSYSVQLLENLPAEMEIHVVTLKRVLNNGDRAAGQSKPAPNFGKNVHIHYISDATDTFFYNARFQLSCLREIPKLHGKHHFDMVHSHHCHMPDILLQLLGALRIPTVSTVHNTFWWIRASILKQMMGFQSLDRSEKGILVLYPVLKRLERFYLRSVHSLIAPSERCKEELINFLHIPPRKIHVVYNGVDPEMFSPSGRDDPAFLTNPGLTSRPLVLFTGRMVAQKGLKTLIAAAPLVVKHLPDVLFMFVGAGDFSSYHKWLKEYGVSDYNFLDSGYVSYLDMPKVYSSATVFVLPSPHENCSISILEAMSCRKAVIAANVGGNSEIIQPDYNGMLFASQNSKELAEMIIQLIEDSSLQEKLGVQARKTVIDKFSVRKMAAKTVGIYEEAVDSYREGRG